MLKIKTKWGNVSINPENIYEVHIVMNPWANMYKITFIMDDDFQQIDADLESSSELMTTIKQLTFHTDFIRQYKYVDETGRIRVNKSRRLQLMQENGK